MGLDTVELVLEVEDEFDISIYDDDFQSFATVGDLTDYVVDRLAAAGRLDPLSGEITPCSSPRHFTRLRRSVMGLYHTPRAAVRVRTRLEDVVPCDDRSVQWKRLGESLGLQLPGLCRPKWLSHVLGWASFALIGAILCTWLVLAKLGAAPPEPLAAAALTSLCAGIAAIVMAYRLTRPLAVHVPDFLTVGGLVLQLERAERRRLAPQTRWSRDQAAHAIRSIVSEQFGVPLEQVTREARFVEDLWAD
jgi:acyl carrier protein